MSDFTNLSKVIDSTLHELVNSPKGFIPIERVSNDNKSCSCNAFAFLVQEGYAKEVPSGFYVTFKGQLLHSKGGLTRKDFVEGRLFHYSRTAYVCGIITVILSLCALIVSLVALLV